MAILNSNVNKKKKMGIIKPNAAVKKLQKSLLSGKRSSSESYYKEYVPDDVEEGHFAAVAMHSNERRRFVVPLRLLNHPIFLRLLEKAAEEFGFSSDGAVTIPCSPIEFEKILHVEGWII